MIDGFHTAGEGATELEFCEECQCYAEIIYTERGTFLNCDCQTDHDESYRELDFNDT